MAPQTAAANPTNGVSVLQQPGQQEITPGTASSEDWSMENLLNDSGFDWNYFLTADMPAFQSFAPDGTM